MKKLKICIVLLISILIGILIAIGIIIAKREETPSYNIPENSTNTERNTVSDFHETEANFINNGITENNQAIDSKLKKNGNETTYFILKKCMEKYYTNYTYLSGEGYNGEESEEELEPLADSMWDLLDEEAKNTLGLNEDNLENIHENLDFPTFSIDEIYEQGVSISQNIYLVYHRIEVIDGKEDRVILIRLDSKNNTFCVYPYQYVQMKNYIGLKENDELQVENKEEISVNNNNSYEVDDIEVNNVSYVKELYDKYRFDLYFDLEHLYNSLNEEYKTSSFEDYSDFYRYIEENYDELRDDELQKYRTYNITNGLGVIGIGKSGRNYVFDMINLTEYKVMLDGYTVENQGYKNLYNAILPEGKGRYSVNRIMSAINDKNYKFLYEKINEVQKQNYYSNYEDFENFIKTNFFEKNDYEIQERGQMISQNVYQYLVKVTDKVNSEATRAFTITIYLEDEDFKFGITR